MAGRRLDIEGTRAVAILAVVLYHAGVGSGGFVGVDVFFVLSGYLITSLLWDELQRTRRIEIGDFYARRARRLLPAAVAVLLITLFVSTRVLSPLEERAVTKDAAAAAVYAQNLRLAATHVDYLTPHVAPSPVQHYWSLAVEEQFYLLWPLCMFGVAMLGRRCSRRVARNRAFAALLVAAVASYLLSWWLTRAAPTWAFFSLPSRAWELMGGGLLALNGTRHVPRGAPARAVLGWAGLGAIVWSCVAFGSGTPFPGTAALLPIAGTIALLAAGAHHDQLDWSASAVLSRGPFVAIGRISYSWYLWHWPVLVLVPAWVGHTLSLPARLGLAALSAGLAVLTVRVIENPIRFGTALIANARRSLAFGAALTAIALGASVTAAASLPSLRGHGAATSLRPDVGTVAAQGSAKTTAQQYLDAVAAPIVRAVAGGVATRAVPSNLSPTLDRAYKSKAKPFEDGCDNAFTDAQVHTCTYDTKNSMSTVVLFGDSHAAQWFPAVDLTAKQRGWRLENLSKATCPPVALPIYSPVLHRNFWECSTWRAAALARIERERPDVVIIDAARHYGPEYHFHVYSAQWVAALRTVVARVRATGAHVIVLGPTPWPFVDVPNCVAQHLGDATACTRPRAEAVDQAGEAAERTAIESTGARYVDVAPWMCTSTTCAVIVGNLLVYSDDNHLTVEYAAWLSPIVTAEIDVATGQRG